MKKFKAVLAILLVAALFCTLLAACGTSEDPGTAGDNQQQNGGEIDYGDTNDDEIIDIYISYLDVEGVYDESERIEAAMNEITEPEGIHVELLYFDMGSYATQLSLLLAGNERLDVMNVTPLSGTRLTLLKGNNQLMDVREELETYAAEAIEICSPYDSVYRDGDAMYGLPTNRIHTSNAYWILRKDILEACGLVEAAEQADSWSDLEAIFAGVKDYCDEQGIYVIAGQRSIAPTQALWDDSFEDAYFIDRCGDSTNLILIQDGIVSAFYENDQAIAMMERVNTWEENGWIYPDSIIGDDHTDNIMKQGITFSFNNTSEMGVESVKYASTGYEVIAPITAEAVVVTNTLATFGIAVPVTCQEPEAACKWINMLYTIPEMTTLFCWGVEGVDYVLNENGEATYPEGGRTAYHEGDYMIGNQMLVPPWEGNGGDFRERAQAANDAAEASPYLGFLFDSNPVTTEAASLTAVRDEFQPSLLCGQYTEELRQEFMDSLYSVGLQTYIDEMQTQLDAWIAQNG